MEENQASADIPKSKEIDSEPEKMVPQEEVNKLVGYGISKGRRLAEEEYATRLEQLQSQKNAQEENQIRGAQEKRNEEVPRDVDADAVYQQVQERFNQEMQQRQIENEMQQVANNYSSKIKDGPNNYDDFDEITKDFDPTAFPQLVYLVSGIDNAADVIYELSKNPSKLAALDYLAQRSPKQAQAELLKLARSMADNRSAQTDAQSQRVDAPLDRLQPSRISGSNGKMSINDLRNQSWLKG